MTLHLLRNSGGTPFFNGTNFSLSTIPDFLMCEPCVIRAQLAMGVARRQSLVSWNSELAQKVGSGKTWLLSGEAISFQEVRRYSSFSHTVMTMKDNMRIGFRERGFLTFRLLPGLQRNTGKTQHEILP